LKNDDLVKSLKTVTPAEAGVQISLNLLDSRFRRNDKNGEVATFYETIKNGILGFHSIQLQKEFVSNHYSIIPSFQHSSESPQPPFTKGERGD
jgi:hypothetical protein